MQRRTLECLVGGEGFPNLDGEELKSAEDGGLGNKVSSDCHPTQENSVFPSFLRPSPAFSPLCPKYRNTIPHTTASHPPVYRRVMREGGGEEEEGGQVTTPVATDTLRQLGTALGGHLRQLGRELSSLTLRGRCLRGFLTTAAVEHLARTRDCLAHFCAQLLPSVGHCSAAAIPPIVGGWLEALDALREPLGLVTHISLRFVCDALCIIEALLTLVERHLSGDPEVAAAVRRVRDTYSRVSQWGTPASQHMLLLKCSLLAAAEPPPVAAGEVDSEGEGSPERQGGRLPGRRDPIALLEHEWGISTAAAAHVAPAAEEPVEPPRRHGRGRPSMPRLEQPDTYLPPLPSEVPIQMSAERLDAICVRAHTEMDRSQFAEATSMRRSRFFTRRTSGQPLAVLARLMGALCGHLAEDATEDHPMDTAADAVADGEAPLPAFLPPLSSTPMPPLPPLPPLPSLPHSLPPLPSSDTLDMDWLPVLPPLGGDYTTGPADLPLLPPLAELHQGFDIDPLPALPVLLH